MDSFSVILDQYKKQVLDAKGNCIIYNMPDAVYRAMPGISKSGLDHLHRSPAHYIYNKEHPDPETPALFFGRAVHTAVLEASSFEQKYFPMPEVDGRTKDGKAAKQAALEVNIGKIPLTKDQHDKCYAMQTKVMSHPYAKNVLCHGESEVSLFATIDGVQVKGRADFLTDGVIVDYKTTEDAGSKFARSCVNYRYHVQMYVYRELLKVITGKDYAFIIIAQEKEPPHEVALYLLEDEFLIRGKQKFEQDLAVYKRCLETGIWQGYPSEIQTLVAPEFIQYQD